MKIYEIGTGYTPIPAQMGAATEIVVEELAKAFAKQGIPVEIIDIASSNRTPTQLPIREVSVPKVFTATDVQLGLMHKLKRVIYSVCLARELKKLLKTCDDKPVLHFHNQYNLFFFLKLVPRCLREKCLIAYTNHSGIWRQDWEKIKNTIRRRYFQEAECMRRADVVFLLNQETKENVNIHLGVPANHLVLIENGVNTEIYYPLTDKEKKSAREQYSVENSKVILQVGSVNENKGQLRALEYLLPLMKQYPDLVYAYAGGVVDAEYQERIVAFSRENGLHNRIRYMGMITPGRVLNTVYNCATATILPSRFESFGLVVVESLAAGIPVFLDKDGMVRFDKGVIFYDENSFFETVVGFLYGDTKQVEQLQAQARIYAQEEYSWDKIAKNYYLEFENRMK